MTSNAYNKYSDRFKYNDLVRNLKYFHNRVKEYYITKYCFKTDILIDIGSGRGTDAKKWMMNGIKFIIGIEPSSESIKIAIRNYNKYKKEIINETSPDKYMSKIIYLNGVGDKIWSNGSAALSNRDKSSFIYLFKQKSVKATNINMFWTIHYMLDTVNNFRNIITNLDRNSVKGTVLTILCMDGKKIYDLIKENNGSYVIKSQDSPIFSLEALYDYNKSIEELGPYGNKILVKLEGTYGLEKGIEENLVFIDQLNVQLGKIGFSLIESTPFLDVNVEQRSLLTSDQEKVSDLYRALVYKRLDYN